MSDFETQAAIDVPQQEAKQEKVKKAYRYPEKLRPFVHPELSLAAIACVCAFVWSVVCKVVFISDFWGCYFFPLVGLVVNAIYAFVALFVGKKLHGKFNIINWLAPAILAVAFAIDTIAELQRIMPGAGDDWGWFPETTIYATIDGYVLQSVYPVVEGWKHSGKIIFFHQYMPSMLVALTLLAVFTIIPSLVASKHLPDSAGETKTMFRLSVVYGVIFAVIIGLLIGYIVRIAAIHEAERAAVKAAANMLLL